MRTNPTVIIMKRLHKWQSHGRRRRLREMHSDGFSSLIRERDRNGRLYNRWTGVWSATAYSSLEKHIIFIPGPNLSIPVFHRPLISIALIRLTTNQRRLVEEVAAAGKPKKRSSWITATVSLPGPQLITGDNEIVMRRRKNS